MPALHSPGISPALQASLHSAFVALAWPGCDGIQFRTQMRFYLCKQLCWCLEGFSSPGSLQCPWPHWVCGSEARLIHSPDGGGAPLRLGWTSLRRTVYSFKQHVLPQGAARSFSFFNPPLFSPFLGCFHWIWRKCDQTASKRQRWMVHHWFCRAFRRTGRVI